MANGSTMMRRFIALLILFVSASLSGCDDSIGGYLAASTISSNGFAKRDFGRRVTDGQTLSVWGFVDHANVQTGRCTARVREDPANGMDPPPARWQFNLKARANDRAGESFAVCVPIDDGSARLQHRFLADAAAGRPTRVFVKGRIFTFDAPTNYRHAIGLYMEVGSSADVLPGSPAGEP